MLRRVPLEQPFGAAWGDVGERELLVVRLEDSDGRVGLGEAAPLPGYDGVSLADVADALRDCHGALTRARWLDRAELVAECPSLSLVPQALAAIDTALWDLAGKRAGQPVWRLLGAFAPGPVRLNYTVGAEDRASAAAQAAHARAQGFDCLKIKVAIGDDAGRVAAVRAAAGPEMAVRLDANGGWSVCEAAAGLRVLSPDGIELCEEPVRGLEAVAELSRRTDVPLALDETAADPDALQRRVCQAVCLKLGRCGGITGLLEHAQRARSTGYEVYVSSTLEGPIGIAAALHAAAAIGPERPCGLATLDLFARPRPAELTARAGALSAPSGPGLGAGWADWYA